jgi:hypothetical protein
MKSGNTMRYFLIAKILCCGLLVLALTGGLSVGFGWISNISALSAFGALVLAAAAILLLRRHAKRNPPVGRNPGTRDPKEAAGDEEAMMPDRWRRPGL